MPDAVEQGYADPTALEAVWGEGFMSPGGAEEVARLVASTPLAGLRVLDVGAGLGGAARSLVTRHGAAHVTGFDVQPDIVERANRAAAQAGLADSLHFVQGAPGPLPFAGESFDAVFTKDAMIHVPDKPAILAQMFRVLRPGGHLVFGDWMRGRGAAHDAVLERLFALTTHAFFPHDLGQIAIWVAEAGFHILDCEDRNTWYRSEARRELANLYGPLGKDFAHRYGEDALRDEIEFFEVLIEAVDQGALRPGHIRARKP